MSAHWQVQEITPPLYSEWNVALSQADEGSPYHTPQYLQALAQATDGSVRLVGVFRQGELVGGIGLLLRPAMWRTEATSRLLLYYNGPFVKPSPSAWSHNQQRHRRDVHEALVPHLLHLGLHRIRFKTRQPQADYRTFLANGWRAKPIYSYVANLTRVNRLWDNMDNNVRRLIRRCEQQGVRFTEQGSIDALVDMHIDIELRKNVPEYLPREQFVTFVRQLIEQGQATLFQVEGVDGVPAATQLVLHGAHPVAHMLVAGGTVAGERAGCNAYLRWRSFQWLAERGYRALDLTDAHQPSVARFKEQLGADIEMGLQLELPPTWLATQAEAGWQAAHRCFNLSRRWLRKIVR